MFKNIQFCAENLMFKALCSTTVSVCLKVAYIGLSVANHHCPCTALDVLTALVGSIC